MPKKNKQRFFQLIGLMDGVFQRVIVFGALGGLHPVKDELALLPSVTI